MSTQLVMKLSTSASQGCRRGEFIMDGTVCTSFYYTNCGHVSSVNIGNLDHSYDHTSDCRVILAPATAQL